MNLWHRAIDTLRTRYERSALAVYGAGLHTNCSECAVPPTDVAIPAPRVRRDDLSDVAIAQRVGPQAPTPRGAIAVAHHPAPEVERSELGSARAPHTTGGRARGSTS